MENEIKHVSRYVTDNDKLQRVPVHAVWEVTLACNLKCSHCGSRAGHKRDNELSLSECIEVVNSLHELGTKELTLIGGEAYLRKDWIDIISTASKLGMFVTIQTGGRALSKDRLSRAVDAGLAGVGVSIDGNSITHDRLRGVIGSYKQAIDVLKIGKELGIGVSANTQICALNKDQLFDVSDAIIEAGATHWQPQLTVAMGNAVDNSQILLEPFELEGIFKTLVEIYIKGLDKGLVIVPGNNIGYFGPTEHLWRGMYEASPHWSSCSAGTTVIGIEADGAIKGCPSLETREYTGGNVRDKSIRDIWLEEKKISDIHAPPLWGFCKTCYYASICKAGCTWTSHSLLGKSGNNPYCHHRVIELKKYGIRERIKKLKDADARSFGIGEYKVYKEQIGEDGKWTEIGEDKALSVIEPSLPESQGKELTQCNACNHFIWSDTSKCDFCGEDVAISKERYKSKILKIDGLIRKLESKIST